jgi:hypothetical protein
MATLDEQTRKQLEMHYRILLKEASIIRALLDGNKPNVVAVSDLKGQSVSVSCADLKPLRDR